MLTAIAATKRFGALTALEALSIHIDAGEIVCLLGANGAGKSTTVNLFLGFLQPDAGEVRVAGRPVAADVRAARSHLAYIPDQLNLFPQLSGRENLQYFSRLAGRKLDATEAIRLLQKAGLERAQAESRLGGYSKGMRQKVGIAIALAKNAQALVLDEPLSGLDPLAANEFGARLMELRERGVAILMVTHDVFRAREIADRIGIMRAGRLVELVRAKDIAADALDRLYVAHMRG
jgi:ABC-2 type transport system ATP-binding protein